METSVVLYVGQDTDRTDAVVRQLQDELATGPVRTMTPRDVRQADELGEPACVVYASHGDETESVEFFDTVRSVQPGVPFILVMSLDSETPPEEILKMERTAAVRTDAQGQDVSVLANCVQNLVDSYRREEKLEHAQARFETVFENRIHPIVEVEFDGREPIVQRVNRTFEEVFGYEESEIRGESLDDYIVPSDKQTEATEINDLVVDGEIFSIEVTRDTADGLREFLLQNTVHPDMPYEFAMYTDISERKQRERELERQNERLDRFASAVSHDLRSPLSVASGNLELARDTCENEYLTKAADAIDRSQALIEDLLALAREGEKVDETEPVDLAEVAQSSWQTTETKRAILDVDLSEVIEADRSRLQQLFGNLYRNSVEHGGPDVTVSVGAMDDGFYVADTGPGIPERDREEIFEAGYSTSDEGTGFGLRFVEQIADAHGWEITVAESEQSGARFEITGVGFVAE